MLACVLFILTPFVSYRLSEWREYLENVKHICKTNEAFRGGMDY